MNTSRCEVRLFGSLAFHVGIACASSRAWSRRPGSSRALGRSQVARWRSGRHHSGGANSASIAAGPHQPGRQRHRVAGSVRAREAAAEAGGARRPERDRVEEPQRAEEAAPQTTRRSTVRSTEPRAEPGLQQHRQAATSPMFSQAPGGGGVGSGSAVRSAIASAITSN